jgi:hypothetical protein
LVPHHVESVVEVVWDQLPLFFICSSLSTVSIALLTLQPLLIGFSVKDWFVIVDIEDHIFSSRWKNQKVGEARGVWREIQVIIFVLGV